MVRVWTWACSALRMCSRSMDLLRVCSHSRSLCMHNCFLLRLRYFGSMRLKVIKSRHGYGCLHSLRLNISSRLHPDTQSGHVAWRHRRRHCG